MKTVVICCGGFGINMGKLVAEALKEIGSNTEVISIDGSDSNVGCIGEVGGIDNMTFHRIPNIDGAGKIRAAGYETYSAWVRANVGLLPEADMYILVYSLSGGSGSVIGPLLNSALMGRGDNVINAVLATSGSRKDVENTFNTLTGLGNAVAELERPIHLMVEDSADGTKRSEQNQLVLHNILDVERICTTRHSELDSSDVKAWLNYQTHGIRPALTMIERFDDIEALNSLEGSVITTLSLLTDEDNPLPNVGAVMNTSGLYPNAEYDSHYVTTTKDMENFERTIEDTHKRYQAISDGLNVKDAFGMDTKTPSLGNATVVSGGMVL